MSVASNDDLKNPTTLIKIHTDTGDYKPITLKPYRKPLTQIKQLDEQNGRLIKTGIIRYIIIPWNLSVILLSKRDGGLKTFVLTSGN